MIAIQSSHWRSLHHGKLGELRQVVEVECDTLHIKVSQDIGQVQQFGANHFHSMGIVVKSLIFFSILNTLHRGSDWGLLNKKLILVVFWVCFLCKQGEI